MSTDWQLIRRLVNSTLDTCEAIDWMDISDQERAVLMGGIAGEQGPTVWDGLQSAYIAPEESTLFRDSWPWSAGYSLYDAD